jgi:type I restriction enzyme S subunit
MRPTDALPHPSEWQATTVGRSIEVKRGVSWSKEQEHSQPASGRAPVIGISNVQDRLDLTNILYLSGLRPAAVEKARVSAGWTVMVGSNGNRARIGNAVLVREDAEFLFASFLIGAKPTAGSELYPEYFFRWLSTEQVQAYLSASSEGTTGLSNLSHSFFRAMSIPVPPPDEQAAIARILDAVDIALERTRAAVERARELRQSLIHELLTRGIEKRGQRRGAAGVIPENWGCEPLGELLAEGPTNGVYRPESDYAAHGTRIIRIDDFEDGRIKAVAALRRVVVEPVICDKYAVCPDDVVINRVNSLSHIGKATLVPPLQEPTIFESNMMRVRCGPRMLPSFLNIVLRSDIARKHWLARAKPAVNQASINQRDARELPVPIPGRDGEQGKIVAIVGAAEKQIDALSDVMTAQQQLKKSLMHDLLTGRVRVRGVSKAPAS